MVGVVGAVGVVVLDGKARGVIRGGASELDEKGLQPTSAMSSIHKMQVLDHASNRVRIMVSFSGACFPLTGNERNFIQVLHILL